MKLEPEHYLDIVGKPSLFASVLANKAIANLWIASMDEIKKLPSSDIATLKKIAKNPKLASTIDPLIVAQGIATYIERLLIAWKVKSVLSADALAATAPWFVELSKGTPEINPSNEYKTAFRGTDIDEDELDDFISKTKISDWKKVKQQQAKLTLYGGGTVRYRMYVGPKNNQFMYKPRRAVQSWTVKPEIAAAFGNHLIATPLDKTFFFDPAFIAHYGPNAKEMEIVHFGIEPMKVILLVNDRMFPFDKMADDDDKVKYDKFAMSEIVIDGEEGKLILPL